MGGHRKCVDSHFLHPQPYHIRHQHAIDNCVGYALFRSSKYLFSADNSEIRSRVVAFLLHVLEDRFQVSNRIPKILTCFFVVFLRLLRQILGECPQFEKEIYSGLSCKDFKLYIRLRVGVE